MNKFLLGLAFMTVFHYGWAADFDSRRHPRGEERGEPPRYAIGEATDMVQRRTGGRVVGANPVNVQGRGSYRMKVLTPQGEVRIIHVDPATGQTD